MTERETITRYESELVFGGLAEMRPDVAGQWVRYEDHAAALTAAVAQRDAAERERDALSAWACSECEARFASSVPRWQIDGVTRCSSCAERDRLTAALADATRARDALITALRQKIDDCERDGLCEPAHVRGLEEAIEVVRAQAQRA